MVRRLLLTCAVLVMDSLASTVFFVVCVAIVTLVIEQECKAYENRFLSAFTAIWYGCGSVGSLSVRARLALDPSESFGSRRRNADHRQTPGGHGHGGG